MSTRCLTRNSRSSYITIVGFRARTYDNLTSFKIQIVKFLKCFQVIEKRQKFQSSIKFFPSKTIKRILTNTGSEL